MSLGGGGTATITDSTISDNSASEGGGILNVGSTTTIGDTVLNADEFGGTISQLTGRRHLPWV